MSEKMIKKIAVSGKIKLETGLHIGGTNNAMAIGGPDSMVVRNPIDNKPFIPGSSLKGKMRSLLELSKKLVEDVNMRAVKNGPSSDRQHSPAFLFGTATNDAKNQRPSRVIVRDGKLLNPEVFNNTDLPFTESKTEVVIDRVTSKAMPRQIERVPAGAEFKLDMVINVMESEKDREEELRNNLFRSLQLIQDDYLGGHGSRGSGQVNITIEAIQERTSEYYTEGKDDGERNLSLDEVPVDLRANEKEEE